jgi:hypothetical protein
MEKTFKVGDVFILQAGKSVIEQGKGVVVTVEPDNKEVVIEAIRTFKPGAEDDHFESGIVLDVSPLLVSGEYDHDAPLYTIAASGDFRSEFVQPNITITRHMRKTFVREGEAQ